jgi:hypothetical protein
MTGRLPSAALLRRPLVLALAALAPAPAARAADPVMPLAEVRPGMSCKGLSVVRGTEIVEFGVEVIDLVAAEVGRGGPRILVRVSGPAVDATGVGPGFSGSPILCEDATGTRRNIGAISEGLGDYGNEVALATPIEEILGRAPPSPRRAHRYPRLSRAARPLAGPLTVSGLSTRTRRLLVRALRHGGRTLLVAPAGPLGGYPPPELVPGAAVAVAAATGDVGLGAVGTVAYRDGTSIWAFGHALDGVGRRSLFLQDSYVFGVIGNPLGLPELGAGTYKLASLGGNVQGTLTSDTFAAVGGTLGREPASVPLRTVARERGGSVVSLDSRLADERALGYRAGLGLVAPIAASQALDRLLGSVEPVTLSMCARFHVRERRRAIAFCNPYFDALTPLNDLAAAASLVDSYDLSPLHIERAEVRLRARRGVVSYVLVGASAPRRVRAGERIRVYVTVRRRGGGRRTIALRIRVPRSLRPGARSLVLVGNGRERVFEDELVLGLSEALPSGSRAGGTALRGGSAARSRAGGAALGSAARSRAGGARDGSAARSIRDLAGQVSGLRRPLGIEARFRRRRGRVVYRSDEAAFEGRARLALRVMPMRR